MRGRDRAAQVHELKAQGLSPSRKGWREAEAAAATTPAVEVTLSPEAAAALEAEAPAPAEVAPAAVAPEPAVEAPSSVVTDPAVAAPTLEAAADPTDVVNPGTIPAAFLDLSPEPEPGTLLDVAVS